MGAATIRRVADEVERGHERAADAGDEAAWAALVRERALALGSSTWVVIDRSTQGADAAEKAGWRRLSLGIHGEQRSPVWGLPVVAVDEAFGFVKDVPGSIVVDVASGTKFAPLPAAPRPILVDEGWSDDLTPPPYVLPLSKPERMLIGLAKANYESAVRMNKQKLEKGIEAARAATKEIEEAEGAYKAALHGVYASRGYPRLPHGDVDLGDEGLVYKPRSES